MSTREAALAALTARLRAAAATLSHPPAVLRNETVPQRLHGGGLIVLQDGETTEETPMLSPLAWQIEHTAEIEIYAPGATSAERTGRLDAILTAIGAAIAGDRLLGGAVEWAAPGSPSFLDVDFEGAAAVRAATVPVQLFFTTEATPLS